MHGVGSGYIHKDTQATSGPGRPAVSFLRFLSETLQEPAVFDCTPVLD